MSDLLAPLLIGLASAAVAGVGWRLRRIRSRDADVLHVPRPSTGRFPTRSPAASDDESHGSPWTARGIEAVGARRAMPASATKAGVCSVCGRSLRVATGRCPGCRTRLLNGVPARRATDLLAFGAAIGVLIGLFSGLLLASLASRDDPAGVAAATGAPEESVAPAPAGVRAALDGMLAAASRLAAARDGLAAALAEPAPEAASLGGQLRAVDAEAAEAIALSAALDRWPGSRELAGDIRSFNVAVREAAAPGLRGDAAGASAAGTAVLEALTGLQALNARTVDAAREVGLLPPSSAPRSPAVPAPSAPVVPGPSAPASPGGSAAGS